MKTPPSGASAASTTMLIFELTGSPKTLNPKPNTVLEFWKLQDFCWATLFCFSSMANMSAWSCSALSASPGWLRRFKERHICDVPKYLPSTTYTTLPLLPAYAEGLTFSPIYHQDTSASYVLFPLRCQQYIRPSAIILLHTSS